MRKLILPLAAVVLTWLVITRSFAVYLANVTPQTALWFNPQQPDALINLSDEALNHVSSGQASAADIVQQGTQGVKINESPDAPPSDEAATKKVDVPSKQNESVASGTAGARDLNYSFKAVSENASVNLPVLRERAESALMVDPLNARALRLLGQIDDASGDTADCRKFMEAAADMSLHETIALYWLMVRSTETDNFKSSVFYADALLRTNRDLGPYVVPLLAHLSENKAANGLVKTALDANPPWRDLFFAYLTGGIADVRTPLDLLLSLKTTSAPPSTREIGDYLNFLIGHDYYNLAYYTWLQFLPADELRTAGLLFNGNFQYTPSGLPFDWAITQGSGVTIDIEPIGNEQQALVVDFLYGRVDYHSVKEMLLLSPGNYQFTAKYKGQIIGPRGLKWRVACLNNGNGADIGKSPMINGSTPTWTSIDFAFTVPAENCRAQEVRLDLDARTASERLITGSLSLRELAISRNDTASQTDSSSQEDDGSDSQDTKQ